jgi:hypothetical protein
MVVLAGRVYLFALAVLCGVVKLFDAERLRSYTTSRIHGL